MSRTAALVTQPTIPLATHATVEVPPQIVARSVAPASTTRMLPGGASSMARKMTRLSPGIAFAGAAGGGLVGGAEDDEIVARHRLQGVGGTGEPYAVDQRPDRRTDVAPLAVSL